jgi:hypothetical protein
VPVCVCFSSLSSAAGYRHGQIERAHTQSKEVIFFSSYTQDVGCWQRSTAGSIPHIESSRWYIGSIHPPKIPTALPDAVPALIFLPSHSVIILHTGPSMLLGSPVCHLVPTLSRIHSLFRLLASLQCRPYYRASGAECIHSINV